MVLSPKTGKHVSIKFPENLLSLPYKMEALRLTYGSWQVVYGGRADEREVCGFCVSISGYTSHEMLRPFGLINMNGRVYDPLTSRFLSPDNYVQNPANPQNYNHYAYALNNPLKYTDPSGEWINFVIGAIVGGIEGYMIGKAAGLSDWNLFWSTLAGAGIGAATAGIGAAISTSVGGASGVILASTTSGAVGTASFNALSAVANKGSIGDVTEAFMTGIPEGIALGFVGGTIGGAIGWGLYHTSLFYSYEAADIRGTLGLNYHQYAKMIAITQRSMFWGREGKFIPNMKGGVNVCELGDINETRGYTSKDYDNAVFDYHTHQDWGTSLADGEGFSTYASGGIKSDEYTRGLLNVQIKFKGPMYLGTKEGHIFFMNYNGVQGAYIYNFSSVFHPFNMAWALSLNKYK